MTLVKKKILVISGINLFEGGPLTIMQEALSVLAKQFSNQYKIIALVHKKSLYEDSKNLEFIEFPKSRSSWLYRIYYEYYYFKELSIRLKADYWVSMHDITPNVKSKYQFVYCHNPSPFFNPKKSDIIYGFVPVLFSLFYKYLYRINIRKNTHVIVQQDWIREEFKNLFKINNVIVAHPNTNVEVVEKYQKLGRDLEYKTLFFPSYPRSFKNFEIICKAYSTLPKHIQERLKIYLTINGELNSYAKNIVSKYESYKGLNFIGLLSRKEVFEYYNKVDGLLFPSRLETWGLPITEFKAFNKPIVLADLPYAHETLGSYHKAKFFNANSYEELASIMIDFVNNKVSYCKTKETFIKEPFVQNWQELFSKILNHQ